MVSVAASVARARSNMANRAGSVMPAARQAALAVGWSASERTTVTRVGSFRKDNRRVLKEYSSAPNGSGRTSTAGCNS